MKDILAVIALVIVALVVILGLTWICQGNDFFLHKYFDSKYEDNRRNTFEHSKAYNDSWKQELSNQQAAYIQASKEHKAALRSVILHQAVEYDETRLPTYLQDFLRDLRNEPVYTPERTEK